MSEFQRVAAADEIPENSAKTCVIDDKEVLVCNAAGEFHTLENRCSHQNQPLAGGRIRNVYILCPLHGMRVKLATGEAVGQLTRKPVKVFDTRLIDNEVQVLLID